MKGIWVYDPTGDVWHVLWDRNHPDGAHYTGTTGCNKEANLEWLEKKGENLGWSDTLHDECVRKSEELD